MQSILQYRRFRTAAAAQIERDKVKTRKPAQSRTDADLSPTSMSSEESKLDLESGHSTRDIEQAQQGTAETPMNEEKPGEDARVLGMEEVEEEEEEREEGENDQDPDLRANVYSTLSRTTTVQSTGTALGRVLTGIQVRRRTTRDGGTGNVFVVNWEGSDDPQNPHNWSFWVRLRCTFLVAAVGCVVGFASAIDSSAIPQASKDFGVSEVVESLATGLFLVGFGLGALFAGPISETVGRNPVYIGTLTLYMIFIMASALAPNIGSQLAFRFIAGFFGSTPLTCAGGSISDLWNPLERVYTFPIFANAAFTGPLLGPVMGDNSAVSWRWVEWTTLLFSGLVTILVVLFQPETFPPVLLKWKAKHIRAITGDDRYRAEIEVRQEAFFVRLRRALYRPFLLTFREPIILIWALYITVVYIILFTFLDGYDYVFEQTYGISQGLTGLAFLGIIIGLFGASALVPINYRWALRDLRKIKAAGGDRLPPEFRLWYSMLGGAIAVPVSLFWMGWTARPDISIWSPLCASLLFGFGVLTIFLSCYSYLIDAYETYAASALASVTLIRYVVSGGMVVVGIPFYENLGVPYTLTILACISALLVPYPYLLFRYGVQIRKRSKYAVAFEQTKG